YWPESLHDPRTWLFSSIYGADKNHVALVALHVLQIFNEELFESVIFLFPGFNILHRMRVARQRQLEFFANEISLFLIECDDPKRAIRVKSHEFQRGLDHRLRFDGVRA